MPGDPKMRGMDSTQTSGAASGAADTHDRPARGARRRRSTLAIHAGLYVAVNGFMVGTWVMTKLAPGTSGHRKPPAGFWPGWMIVTWGFVLVLHALYVWARRTTQATPDGWTSDPRRRRVVSTVLFTDIVGSTRLAAELGDQRWGELLERHDRRASDLVERFGGRMGEDAGRRAPGDLRGAAGRDLCARALREDLKADGIDIRAGLHSGEVDLRQGDVGGIGVHIASRVMAAAERSEILASRTVRDLVTGSEIAFQDRGSRELKGVRGIWQVFAVAEVGMNTNNP